MEETPSVVFVIDDEQNNLDLLERALGEQYEVHAFRDPHDAVRKATELKPVVVVTDYRMPSMDGVQLVKTLRDRGLRCVAVLITAYAHLDEVVSAAKSRILYRVLPKPWRPAKLLDEVELAIKLHRLNAAVQAVRDFDTR